MSRYHVTNEQLERLKEIAVLVRNDETSHSDLGYEMEQIVATVEATADDDESDLSDEDASEE